MPGNIIPANRAAATAASKANLRMSFLPATQSNNYLREARAGPCAKSTCIVSVASAKAFMLPVAAHPRYAKQLIVRSSLACVRKAD